MDYVLNATSLDTIQKALDRSLKAPASTDENPTFKPGAEDGLGTWTEAFIIRDTSWATPKTPKPGVKAMVAQVQLEVLGPSGGGFTTNEGASHFHTAYLDMGAVNDSKDKMQGIYLRRIGVINQLAQAAGLDPTLQEVSLNSLLNADPNGLKMLVGLRVGGVVRKYKYTKGKNTPTAEVVTTCEIDAFMALPS